MKRTRKLKEDVVSRIQELMGGKEFCPKKVNMVLEFLFREWIWVQTKEGKGYFTR